MGRKKRSSAKDIFLVATQLTQATAPLSEMLIFSFNRSFLIQTSLLFMLRKTYEIVKKLK